MKLLHDLPLLAALTLSCLAVNLHAQGITEPRPLAVPAEVDTAELKDTGRQAIAELMAEFAAQDANAQAKTFAILPLPKDIDQGYFTLQFENAFTQKAGASGFKLYTRRDQVLEQVLVEIDFQQNFADAVKESTRNKLALEGVEAVILPRIDLDRSANGAVTLRATVSVHHVVSGEKLWGHEVARVIAPALTNDQILHYGVIGLAAIALLLILIWLLRTVRAAARPR
jgi:hypothetical protein